MRHRLGTGLLAVVLAPAFLLPQRVLAQATTTTLIFSPTSPQTFGVSVTITARVTGASTPTGSVTFADGGSALASGVPLSPANATTATASFAVANLLPGTHTIAANYNPTGGFAASSDSAAFGIVKIYTATHNPFGVAPAGRVRAYQPAEFQVTSSPVGGAYPNGQVRLHVGTGYNATRSLSYAGTASFSVPAGLLTVGPQTVSLDYIQGGASDPWESASGLSPLSFSVLPAIPALTLTPGSPDLAVGGSNAYSVTIAVPDAPVGAPAGTITLTDSMGALPPGRDSCSVGSFTGNQGSCRIVVAYNGAGGPATGGGNHTLRAAYVPAVGSSVAERVSNAVTVPVAFAEVAQTLTAAPGGRVQGDSVTLTCKVEPGQASPGLAAPTGQVTFLESGLVLGTVPLSSGIATLTVGPLSSGQHPITATYGGDFIWGTSSRTTTVSLTKAATKTSLALSLDADGQVVLKATVTPVAPTPGLPTGSVRFKDISDGTELGTVALTAASGSLKLSIAAASRPIAAVFEGDSTFNGSTSPSLPVAISGVGIRVASFAPDQIVSVYNVSGLSGDTPAPEPLPTDLAGVAVKLLDSTGAEHPCPLFGVFGAAGQINLLIPAGTALGPTLMTIALPDGSSLATALNITAVSPAIFTANMDGKGAYAGQIVRVEADGSQTSGASVSFDAQQKIYVPQSIAPWASGGQVFLILYGTGIRGAAAGQVSATIGGKPAAVSYAGAQAQFPGLDQVNIEAPPGLEGAGLVNVVVTVNGQPANTVTTAFQ